MSKEMKNEFLNVELLEKVEAPISDFATGAGIGYAVGAGAGVGIAIGIAILT